jgi:copper resistance protein C
VKRIFIAAVIFLLAMSISTSAFAHSHLEGSNPADGDVVTEPLSEIVLEFDGQIEQGSFMDVTTEEGQAIELQEIIIGEGTLTGTMAEPLPNNKYQVNWNIMSADGHPLEGEFSFTVNAEVPETGEEPVKTTEAVEDEGITESTEPPTEGQESETSANEVDQGSSSMTVILIILLVVIVIGFFILLIKRKK